MEDTGVDSWVKLLECAVRELPGVFKGPECVAGFDGVVRGWGMSDGYGFAADDDFCTDGKTSGIKLRVYIKKELPVTTTPAERRTYPAMLTMSE